MEYNTFIADKPIEVAPAGAVAKMGAAKAAQEFEAVFVAEMLRPMFSQEDKQTQCLEVAKPNRFTAQCWLMNTARKYPNPADWELPKALKENF